MFGFKAVSKYKIKIKLYPGFASFIIAGDFPAIFLLLKLKRGIYKNTEVC